MTERKKPPEEPPIPEPPEMEKAREIAEYLKSSGVAAMAASFDRLKWIFNYGTGTVFAILLLWGGYKFESARAVSDDRHSQMLMESFQKADEQRGRSLDKIAEAMYEIRSATSEMRGLSQALAANSMQMLEFLKAGARANEATMESLKVIIRSQEEELKILKARKTTPDGRLVPVKPRLDEESKLQGYPAKIQAAITTKVDHP
jgi:hypothetical protein